jgi:hypothetical protein
LAERVAYICSNPDCRSSTIGPHSDPGKSLDTGVAAHIHGAAKGGPRYDPNQTSEERKHITNGIWLCAECARVIDTDESRYSPETLKRWKSEQEQWVSGQEAIPKLPILTIEDLQGLSLPATPGAITSADVARIRERRLVLKNPNRVSLFQFDLRLQLPEPIIALPRRPTIPPGANLRFEPEYVQFMAFASGEGAQVTVNRPPRPTPNWTLGLDRLPAQSGLDITIWTIPDWMEHDFPQSVAEPEEPENLKHYINGTYSFEYRREQVRRPILLPLRYDRTSRQIQSLQPQSGNAPYTLSVVQRWG